MVNTWITLINSDFYFKGALGLYFSLQRVKTKYPFKILIVENSVSEENLEILKSLNIEYFLIKDYSFISIKDYNGGSHASTLNKFQLYDLRTRFDKVCFIDADVLLYKNLDYIFNFDFFFTKGFTGLISGGIFLINLNKDTLEFKNVYDKHCLWDNDEQVLNYYYLEELFNGPEFDYTINGGLYHAAGAPKYWEKFELNNINQIKNFIKRINKRILDDDDFFRKNKEIILKLINEDEIN